MSHFEFANITQYIFLNYFLKLVKYYTIQSTLWVKFNNIVMVQVKLKIIKYYYRSGIRLRFFFFAVELMIALLPSK